MYIHVTIDALVRMFQNGMRYADAHNHGNEHSILQKLCRDVDSLRSLPDEAFNPTWDPTPKPQPDFDPNDPANPANTQNVVNTTANINKSRVDYAGDTSRRSDAERASGVDNTRQAQGPAQWPGQKPLSGPAQGEFPPPAPKPYISPNPPPGTPPDSVPADGRSDDEIDETDEARGDVL